MTTVMTEKKVEKVVRKTVTVLISRKLCATAVVWYTVFIIQIILTTSTY